MRSKENLIYRNQKPFKKVIKIKVSVESGTV